MKYQILVVEDQADIANVIKINLELMDAVCEVQSDGKKALEQAIKNSYDVVILDVMLPNLSGLEICSALREEKPMQSIIMLTSKNSELDRVSGLELGADDYMTKPFSVLELQARVKSQLRKVELLKEKKQDTQIKQEVESLNFAQLEINIKQHQVKRAGKAIDLTNLEFDLLLFMAKSPSEVFSRTQLLENVWGYNHSGYEHTVNSHINRLRNKVEADANNPEYIQTVWGVGYKFEVDLNNPASSKNKESK